MAQAVLLDTRPVNLDEAAAHKGVEALPTALLAECTCPGSCERDHDQD